jgi:hypothetical protein
VTKKQARYKRYYDKMKSQVFDHYGRQCKCCGEDTEAFLTIDHKLNDGAEHRRQMTSRCVYRWIIKNNFPETFQTLCYNCNCGKRCNNGICPHQRNYYQELDQLHHRLCKMRLLYAGSFAWMEGDTVHAMWPDRLGQWHHAIEVQKVQFAKEKL